MHGLEHRDAVADIGAGDDRQQHDAQQQQRRSRQAPAQPPATAAPAQPAQTASLTPETTARQAIILDFKTGKVLWQTRLGAPVQGFPVTFTAGGEQYVAVSTGLGGGSPRVVPRILTPEIRHPRNGNALYVFKLP